jgi:hypothetical protein
VEEMPVVSGERGNIGGDGADRWVPPDTEREVVGDWAGLAAGPVLLRVGPVGCCLSLFSFFFELFLFLFSYFLF